jgi:hypothetical protein
MAHPTPAQWVRGALTCLVFWSLHCMYRSSQCYYFLEEEIPFFENKIPFVRFDVFTAMTMKKAAFWDVAPCISCVNRRFGGTYRLQLDSVCCTCSRWFARGFLPSVFYTAPYPRRLFSSKSRLYVCLKQRRSAGNIYFYQDSKLQRICHLTTEATTYKVWLRTLEVIPPLEGPTRIYNDVI